MYFGGIGPREAIFGICAVAAVYIAAALWQLLQLARRRRRRPASVVPVASAAEPPPVLPAPVVSLETTVAEDIPSEPPAAMPSPTPPESPAPTQVEQTPKPSVEPPQFPAEIKHSVVRIYVKTASVEVPNMPRLPKYAVQPNIDVGLVVNAKPVWAEHLECSLGITLHAKLNGMNMFLMEVVQCGLFRMHETDPERLNAFVRETAQSVLFPYARKYLAALAVDAGFQPLILDPIDFGDLLNKATQRFRIAPAARTSA